MKGKLIVLYGANNLGKTTQVDLLENALKEKKIPFARVKYPVYELEPTGPAINEVLRGGKKMDEVDLQELYVQNRRDYENQLVAMLDLGKYVIAEDYIGTGIAWGMVRGVELEILEKMNNGLYPADVSIMLYGKRFFDGVEEGHRNETDEKIWKLASEKHDFLAKRYGWKKVSANQTRENVHKDIMKLVDLE